MVPMMQDIIHEKLNAYAIQAALRPGLEEPLLDGPVHLPPAAACWNNEYALLCYWPVDATASASFLDEARKSVAWMHAYLERSAKRGAFLDGYLVLGLPERPSNLESVRDLERDPSVCRKQIVWPEPNDDFERTLRRIPSIGLPSPPHGINAQSVMNLTSPEEALLEKISTLSTATAVFEALEAAAPPLEDPPDVP